MDNPPSSRLQPGQRRRFLLFGAIYVVLWISTWYSARLLDSLGVASLWFLPAGLRFCGLLLLGWRGFQLELAVQFVFALMQITSVAGEPIPEILSTETLWRIYILLASLSCNAVVILPLRRWMRDPWDLARPSHCALFLVAGLAVSTLSALAGTFALVQRGVIAPSLSSAVVGSWLIGDFIGIITLAPLLLVRVWPGLQHYLHQGCWHRRSKAGLAGGHADLRTVLAVVLALLLVFGIPWHVDLNPHFPLIALLLLLPLAGVAMHYGLRSAVLAVVLLDSGLVMLIALFGQRDQALAYQVVMIAIALVGLWLGGAVEVRNRLMVRYRDFAGMSNDLLWETDDKGRFLEVSGRLAEHFALSTGQFWRPLLGPGPQPHLAELEHALTQRQPAVSSPGDRSPGQP